MCVGCAAAYAAIAASTVTFSLSDINGKESAFNFSVSGEELAKAAAITTLSAGTASITIKSDAPATKSAKAAPHTKQFKFNRKYLSILYLTCLKIQAAKLTSLQ